MNCPYQHLLNTERPAFKKSVFHKDIFFFGLKVSKLPNIFSEKSGKLVYNREVSSIDISAVTNDFQENS